MNNRWWFACLIGIGGLGSWSTAARAEPARPNILFCIADDASLHFGAYGCDWVSTPGFDRVAREGLLFARAYTPNAKCAPSRACILTGRNTWQLEEACNHMPFFPIKFKTYVEALADAGYFVGLTAKGWSPGVAKTADGQPRDLAGPAFDTRKQKAPTRAITAVDYAANFADFLNACPENHPFCFWYGCREPHRGYEYGTGASVGGKAITDIDHVPAFWPDNETVRHDMLDYALEVEWFDQHLSRMLAELERRGQLANTLVVVTSDNGMPFPRIKGQEYELSNHLPLAIMWPQGIKQPGRVIDDYVSFVDYAPTFLEVAGVEAEAAGMQPITGRSLVPIFQSNRSGQVVAARDHVLIGKERHDVGRPDDAGYPVRGIVKDGWMYLENFAPDRWPAGNPETGYLNVDGSPTKTQVLELRRSRTDVRFWRQSFGKRPGEELFRITDDPECLNNLAEHPDHAPLMSALRAQLVAELTEQQDPRMLGQGEIFDAYPVATDNAHFYERYLRAPDRTQAGWVNDSDFETGPIDD